MHRGFTKAWRKELDSEIWLMPPVYHRVWFWLRQKVQFEDFLFPTPKSYGVWVCAGQRLTSLQEVAEGVKWTEWGKEVIPNKKTIKSVLDWLEAQGMITAESNAKGTLISVKNWDTYQSHAQDESNAEETLTGTRSGHKKRITKNVKEVPSATPSGDDEAHEDVLEDTGKTPEQKITAATELLRGQIRGYGFTDDEIDICRDVMIQWYAPENQRALGPDVKYRVIQWFKDEKRKANGSGNSRSSETPGRKATASAAGDIHDRDDPLTAAFQRKSDRCL